MATFANFHPITRIIQLLAAPVGGISSIAVQRELYSAGKEDWLATADLRKLHFAFNTEGGTLTTPGKFSGSYFFLRNDLGWRLRPFDADQELTILGMLYPADITVPMILTPAGRTITIFNERSNLAETIEVEATGSPASIAAAVRAELAPELDDITRAKDHAKATNVQTQKE